MVGWMLPQVDRAIGPVRTEEISGDAHHYRGQTRIVGTTSDIRLFLDECLIFPTNIEPRFDRDRTCANPVVMAQRCYKVAHLASGIRVQFEAPLDAISRDGIARGRCEMPVGKPGLSHVSGEEARQRGVMKPWYPVCRPDLYHYLCRGRRGHKQPKRGDKS